MRIIALVQTMVNCGVWRACRDGKTLVDLSAQSKLSKSVVTQTQVLSKGRILTGALFLSKGDRMQIIGVALIIAVFVCIAMAYAKDSKAWGFAATALIAVIAYGMTRG